MAPRNPNAAKHKDEPHVVYYLLDGCEIVYVGVTFEIEQRLRWIKRDNPGWVWDKHDTSEVFKNLRAAHDFERREIRQHQPRYNVQSTTRGERESNGLTFRKYGEGL